MPQAVFEPPGQSHTSFEASALPQATTAIFSKILFMLQFRIRKLNFEMYTI